MISRLLRLLVLVNVVVGTAIAVADDEIARPSNPEARERLSAGTKLYRVQEFEKAIEEYKAGALKEDAPVFHYNLGQCYRHLRRFREAKFHYQRFVASGNPPAKYKLAVEGFIREAETELQKEATAEAASEPIEAPRATPPAPRPEVPEVVTVIERAEPWYADRFGWGLAATGAVASGVAGWLVLDARRLDERSNREPSQEDQAELRQRASQRRLAGAIVGVVGGAALITGIVKLAIADHDLETTRRTALELGVSRNGVVLVGRF